MNWKNKTWDRRIKQAFYPFVLHFIPCAVVIPHSIHRVLFFFLQLEAAPLPV